MNPIPETLMRDKLRENAERLAAAKLLPITHPDRASNLSIYAGAVAHWQHLLDLHTFGVTAAQYEDYRNREIVALVNTRLTNTHLTYVQPSTTSGWIIARSQTGKTHLVVGYSRAGGQYIVRGVVKQQRRGAPCGALCNGQAGTNASQVAWFEENACVVPPAQSIHEYLVAGT